MGVNSLPKTVTRQRLHANHSATEPAYSGQRNKWSCRKVRLAVRNSGYVIKTAAGHRDIDIARLINPSMECIIGFRAVAGPCGGDGDDRPPLKGSENIFLS